MFQSKLDVLRSMLQGVTNPTAPDGVERVRYLWNKKSILEAVKDLETWQALTDQSWFLFMTITDAGIDAALAAKSPQIPNLVPSASTIRSCMLSTPLTGAKLMLPHGEIEHMETTYPSLKSSQQNGLAHLGLLPLIFSTRYAICSHHLAHTFQDTLLPRRTRGSLQADYSTRNQKSLDFSLAKASLCLAEKQIQRSLSCSEHHLMFSHVQKVYESCYLAPSLQDLSLNASTLPKDWQMQLAMFMSLVLFTRISVPSLSSASPHLMGKPYPPFLLVLSCFEETWAGHKE